jgi:hypothetical protein
MLTLTITLRVTSDQMLAHLGGSALPAHFYDAGLRNLHPTVANRFEFWGESSLMRANDYKVGDRVRLRVCITQRVHCKPREVVQQSAHSGDCQCTHSL